MREQSIVGNYYRMEPRKRLEYIVSNYEAFPGVIRDYEAMLEDWILTCRSIARQESLGDLGVRIQSGRMAASATEEAAIERMTVEGIIKDGELDEYSRRLENADEIIRGLKEIKLMRREYDRLKIRLGILNQHERQMLFSYYSNSKHAIDLAEEMAITEKAVRERVYKIKNKLFRGFTDMLGSYSDDTILFFSGICKL